MRWLNSKWSDLKLFYLFYLKIQIQNRTEYFVLYKNVDAVEDWLEIVIREVN